MEKRMIKLVREGRNLSFLLKPQGIDKESNPSYPNSYHIKKFILPDSPQSKARSNGLPTLKNISSPESKRCWIKSGMTGWQMAAVLVTMLVFLTVPVFAQIGGVAWAWGDNYSGQLGNGTKKSRKIPVKVSNLKGVTAIAGGDFHSLALKNDGTVWAWGNNFDSELGNGTYKNSKVPIQVPGLANITAIAGAGLHSLALKNDGTVWVWGGNFRGLLGNGTSTITNSNIPIKVSGLTGITTIAAGFLHFLALKSDGTVWTWGDDFGGQLGNGARTSTISNIPVQVLGLTDIIAIAGGFWHSLALKKDGTVWAWGDNNYGQLGNGTYTRTNIPGQVSGLEGVIAIASGAWHSLALKKDGTVWAWGSNDEGQLGNGTNIDSNIPIQVPGLTRVTAIAGGRFHSLALQSCSLTGNATTRSMSRVKYSPLRRRCCIWLLYPQSLN